MIGKDENTGWISSVLFFLSGALLIGVAYFYPLPPDIICAHLKLPVNYKVFQHFQDLEYLDGNTPENRYIGQLRRSGWFSGVPADLLVNIARGEEVRIVPVGNYGLVGGALFGHIL